jgi:hypothetical protein
MGSRADFAEGRFALLGEHASRCAGVQKALTTYCKSAPPHTFQSHDPVISTPFSPIGIDGGFYYVKATFSF